MQSIVLICIVFNDVITPINMENLQIFLHFNLDAEDCARLLHFFLLLLKCLAKNVAVRKEDAWQIVLESCAMQVQQRFIKYLD